MVNNMEDVGSSFQEFCNHNGKSYKLMLKIFHRSGRRKPSNIIGLPLEVFCHENEILQPLKGLLDILYIKGTITPDIFRRAPNYKRAVEVARKLSAYGFEGFKEPHIAASIIKQFLSALETPFFSMDTYNVWKNAECCSDERKINVIHEIFDSLTNEKQIFFRHLICILHYIHLNENLTHMNAFSLGICIGSALFRNNILDLDYAKEFFKRTANFISFTVKNCIEIFDEGILTIFEDKYDTEIKKKFSFEENKHHRIIDIGVKTEEDKYLFPGSTIVNSGYRVSNIKVRRPIRKTRSEILHRLNRRLGQVARAINTAYKENKMHNVKVDFPYHSKSSVEKPMREYLAKNIENVQATEKSSCRDTSSSNHTSTSSILNNSQLYITPSRRNSFKNKSTGDAVKTRRNFSKITAEPMMCKLGTLIKERDDYYGLHQEKYIGSFSCNSVHYENEGNSSENDANKAQRLSSLIGTEHFFPFPGISKSFRCTHF